ncbi:hypothetical protein CWE14_12150 [Aliidiomarina soli]|uniref:Uncharacterized protein n=2 Tax=Aliidiomarina soli TaxID=1928574 RepID=A0A432WEE2_9GAMM|nr:hypothetical protein CWE14_12150 [Aliidiomarina soli]
MKKLSCIGVDGEIREYTVSISKCLPNICIEVEAENVGAGKLEMALMPEGELLWVKYIERPYTEPFVGRGVAETLIIELVMFFKKQLTSTSTYSACGEYGRSESATKMWKRLVARSLALYDEVSDRFVTSIDISS